MTTPRRLTSIGLSAGLAVALAGCMSGGGPSGGTMRTQPVGVEGSWIDAQGTGVSTFSGGVFTTVATDTGQKLAEGSYSMIDGSAVKINGTSLIRQSPISFNCLLVSTSQLNCTSSTNAQFVLTRRA